MKDLLIRATAGEGTIKLVAVMVTETIQEAKLRHELSYITSVILGLSLIHI